MDYDIRELGFPEPYAPRLRPCTCGEYVAEPGKERCALCDRRNRRKMFGRTRCLNCERSNGNARAGNDFCSLDCREEYVTAVAAGEDPEMVGIELVRWPPPRLALTEGEKRRKRAAAASARPPEVVSYVVQDIGQDGTLSEGKHFEEMCYCKPGYLSPPCLYVRTGEMTNDEEDSVTKLIRHRDEMMASRELAMAEGRAS